MKTDLFTKTCHLLALVSTFPTHTFYPLCCRLCVYDHSVLVVHTIHARDYTAGVEMSEQSSRGQLARCAARIQYMSLQPVTCTVLSYRAVWWFFIKASADSQRAARPVWDKYGVMSKDEKALLLFLCPWTLGDVHLAIYWGASDVSSGGIPFQRICVSFFGCLLIIFQ